MEKKKFNFKKFGIVLCLCFMTLFAFIPFTNFNNISSVSASSFDSEISLCSTATATATADISGYVFKSNSVIIPTSRYRYYYRDNVRQYASSFAYSGYDENNGLSNIDNFSYLFSLFSIELKYDDNGDLLFAPYLSSFNLVNPTDTDYEFSSHGSYHLEPYSFINYVSSNYINYKYGYCEGFMYLKAKDWFSNVDILFTNDGIFDTGNNPDNVLCGVLCEALMSTETLDITRITRMTTTLEPSTTGRSKYIITYYDINSNYIQFRFMSNTWNAFHDIPDSTYYFSNDGLITDNDMYSQGYDSGHTDGYNYGYNLGLGEGYDEGYESGNTIGYNNGYNQGLSDSNEYTFHSLFGAVLDAPVKVFSDLFNFNLLGVNLLGLITGLFTLAMIILILKLVFGGK